MNRKEIEDYIEKLKEFENDLTSDNDIDDNFINQLNGVLNKIGNDIKKETSEIPTINNTLVVKVKKIHSNAIIPSYSKIGDAGMDLTITSIIENTSFSVSYGSGLSMEIPKGFVGLIFPRSSVRNYELSLTNCVGVIDSGYRGEIQATFRKHSGLDSISYKVGDRGAQIVILPYPQVTMVESSEISNTERGEGGIGSTGV